jgi:hypothetical protein
LEASAPEIRTSSLSTGRGGARCLEFTHQQRSAHNEPQPEPTMILAILVTAAFFAPIAVTVFGNIATLRA